MRRRLILPKQDLLAKGFFTSYFIDVETFYFVSELIQYVCQGRREIRLRSQVIRVYIYTKIQGPRFQRNYIIARVKKVIYMAPNFNHRRIIYSVVFTCSKVINALKQYNSWTDTFRKSSKFNLSYTCVASIPQRFLVPVSTVSTRNAWHNNFPFEYKV